MHIACFGVNVIFAPAGIACHAAALGWQINQSNIAYDTYEDCI